MANRNDAAVSGTLLPVAIVTLLAIHRIEDAVEAEAKLDWEQSMLLLEMAVSDGPLRVGELAAACGINKSVASRRLARMQAMGLVQYTEDDQDQRAVYVALQPQGLTTVDSVVHAAQLGLRDIMDPARYTEKSSSFPVEKWDSATSSADDDPGSVQAIHGGWMRYNNVYLSIRAGLAQERGLSVMALLVLMYLQHKGEEENVGAFATRMFLKKDDVSRALKSLKSQSYIERRRDDEDRRIVWVSITPEGEACLGRVLPGIMDTVCALPSIAGNEMVEALSVSCADYLEGRTKL